MTNLTQVQATNGNSRTVHLAVDAGSHSTPLCGRLLTRRTDTTDLLANCPSCIATARREYLDIEGLVAISPRVQTLVWAVRTHARDRCVESGWDAVIQTYGDSEIAELIRRCRTAAGAIDKMAEATGTRSKP